MNKQTIDNAIPLSETEGTFTQGYHRLNVKLSVSFNPYEQVILVCNDFEFGQDGSVFNNGVLRTADEVQWLDVIPEDPIADAVQTMSEQIATPGLLFDRVDDKYREKFVEMQLVLLESFKTQTQDLKQNIRSDLYKFKQQIETTKHIN
ncbi:hypothetical protein FDJ25_gp156 [Vibrio phage Aphrodite1]|uniref:Uncharacterized protein n=3 Tax=Aphroditevirus TaxID=2560092 RepID=A0A2I7QI55_9CAUD|nr:hypothetical protein FDJ25_gp156 [Vibrio phage Aphrodite1]YP_009847770.1 hypothetical protein HWC35_gp034 [Vibrio phage USC-1]AUR81058.1 hypothetical protein Aphrodite1_0045 [Vibrio phage Aphrodite1]QCW23300.1 hypothetical protein [Vibrio phage 5 TSL-2019]QDH47428.1 hypothetical protein [Vibrio phage USC-1]